MTTAINPQRVRYIKLGTGGCWEKECRKKGIVRFGFGSCSAERFPLCQSGRWDELGPYSRMFYVHHSGTASTDDDRVFVIGPEKLPELVLDAGLASWLIRKVS